MRTAGLVDDIHVSRHAGGDHLSITADLGVGVDGNRNLAAAVLLQGRLQGQHHPMAVGGLLHGVSDGQADGGPVGRQCDVISGEVILGLEVFGGGLYRDGLAARTGGSLSAASLASAALGLPLSAGRQTEDHRAGQCKGNQLFHIYFSISFI